MLVLINRILLIVFFLSFLSIKDGKSQHAPVYLDQHFKPELIKVAHSKSSPILTKPTFKKFDVNTLPIFCKTEYKWSKLSGINVRMRLGSLEYVDKLEGK